MEAICVSDVLKERTAQGQKVQQFLDAVRSILKDCTYLYLFPSLEQRERNVRLSCEIRRNDDRIGYVEDIDYLLDCEYIYKLIFELPIEPNSGLKGMAKCLGCSVDYLLGLTEHKNYETNIEFNESLSILSKALCSVPEPFRNKWLDVLAGTAQWLSKDLNANARLNFSAVVFFNALTELAGYCLEAEEKEADGSYSEEIASSYRCKRFSTILALRNELNTLDAISNEMIEKSKRDE